MNRRQPLELAVEVCEDMVFLTGMKTGRVFIGNIERAFKELSQAG
ncbi:MAG: hypothetical protein AB9891_15250 [Anaerolineaceae bacterium]